MKILIAEDDAVDFTTPAVNLERMGHEVVVTRTGTEAWKTFDRAPVRVVVSDWMIPGLDGLEFCHRECGLVRTHRHIYFILLTALGASAENYVLATEAGIDDFLPKPLDPITIQMRLRVAAPHFWFTREVHQLKQLIPICALLSQNTHGKGLLAALRNLSIKQQTGSASATVFARRCREAEMTKIKNARTDLCDEARLRRIYFSNNQSVCNSG